ncbi:MAG: lysylphosphatidylglycerol synthase transmembrane domain-containing protein [Gammaproteobacteria bacterium]|nr:hypothetical protein [Chromatiales bacterium]MDP6149773.1 lysylphosphatidylglycerol synthase transmembrane domain-containing protein [Gammaproteobacteria bacterium]MDP7094091.1 lysylphosphatidylglycerol synthase transmembrane domain-containing protein [Gammaproteobacteria bacterium]MDP7297159.1 lysylphosphatidylglycerol synthase transmembrane domain-containing protein [Gammaproteobacteria bacterium]HJP04125.1 lysylphosphatidylglycerol synthase transmembrane domain-containing protein [Gammapr
MALSPKQLRQFAIWLVISIAFYGIGISVYSNLTDTDIEATLGSLNSIGISGWVMIIGLSTLNFLLRFMRWRDYLQRLGYRIPVLLNVQYFLGSFAFTITPAKAGEAARSLYLKNDGVRYADSLAALFAERLTDLVAVVFFALGAAYIFEEWRWLVIVAGVATLAVLPLIHAGWVRALLVYISNRLGNDSLQTATRYLVSLLDSSAVLLKGGALYRSMLLSLGAAFSVSLMMYVVLTLLGVEISLPLAVGIYATGILAGALSFLPGGIGSAEVVMLGLLLLAGIDSTVGVLAILMCRIAALWYSIVVGIVIVLRLELAPPRKNRR